jgi:hypothetical protein
MTSYANGASTNSRTSLIPSQQGFWVRSTGASPELIATESIKSATDEPFLKANTLSPGMHISLNKSGLKDEVVLRNVGGTTDDFDSDYDANKVNGSNYDFGQLSIENNSSEKLSIQSNSFDGQEVQAKLFTEIFVSGVYTIDFEDVEELNFSCLKLHDIALDEWYDIYEGASYEFTLQDTLNSVRFEIVKGEDLDIQITDATCYDDADGSIEVSLADTNFQASVFLNGSMTGLYDANGMLSLTDLAAGSYEILLTNLDGVCENESFQIEISSNDQIESIESIVYSETDITVELSIQGGFAPYEVVWEDGQVGLTAVFLESGIYSYSVSDEEGCSIEESVQTDGLLGIGNLEEDEGIVYFNRLSSELNYNLKDMENGQIEIYTIDGKLVYQNSFKQSMGTAAIGEIHSGIYQVVFKGIEATYTYRFIAGN